METVMEDVEEYSWKEVKLPNLIPVVVEPELERETGERRRGRDVLIAIDHGPNSKHAFDWAIVHFCRLADTIHLVHAVSSLQNRVVYDATQERLEKLAVEAFEVAMVKTVARVVEGDPGKIICREAERLKPAAVVMGTRGRSLIKSFHIHAYIKLVSRVYPDFEFRDSSLVEDRQYTMEKGFWKLQHRLLLHQIQRRRMASKQSQFQSTCLAIHDQLLRFLPRSNFLNLKTVVTHLRCVSSHVHVSMSSKEEIVMVFRQINEVPASKAQKLLAEIAKQSLKK